jgi:hypothetical protein
VVDVCLHYESPPENTETRYRKLLAEAEAILETNPEDLTGRHNRATANYYLQNDQQVLEDLNWLIDKRPQLNTPYRLRAVILARLGDSTGAHADLLEYSKRNRGASTNAYVAALVSAHLGKDAEAVATLDVALNPTEAGFAYDAACAYSIISDIVVSSAPDRSRAYQQRALSLLERAILLGYREFAHMEAIQISIRSESIRSFTPWYGVSSCAGDTSTVRLSVTCGKRKASTALHRPSTSKDVGHSRRPVSVRWQCRSLRENPHTGFVRPPYGIDRVWLMKTCGCGLDAGQPSPPCWDAMVAPKKSLNCSRAIPIRDCEAV